jgi:lipoate-protein ligase A
MAIDEYLMTGGADPDKAPILRFYAWEADAYTIGYFQRVDEVIKKYGLDSAGIQVVRRLTGGGLVRHRKDLTFSLVIGHPNRFFPGDTKSSYLKINEALMAGLKTVYPELDFADCKTIPLGRGGKERVCFESPACYDLLYKGKKVVGASQRRSGGAILHQSTVFLDKDHKILREKILEGFKEKWKVDFKEASLTPEELDGARKKEAARYASTEWARRS